MPSESNIRVRLAPSPTGFLHIGTARTALFNWLFARKNNGHFFLRIEDTDRERSTKEFESDILEGLRWLGINWDNEQLYRQTERLSLYRENLEQLLNSGKAFWCHHSKEELEEEARLRSAKKEAPRHICQDKNNSRGKDKGQVIRLAVDENSEKEISFEDNIRGQISFRENLLGDFSIAKDLDSPLYNFAVVVDDIDMDISHVIRGEDHISNTPKQLLIYEALNKKPPEFAHVPLILGSDRSKMSKRHGAVSVSEYKKDYLAEALVNFMGLLGYTYSTDKISIEDMIKEFELSKVHLSGAIFDTNKLNWLNSQYVKELSPEIFIESSGLAGRGLSDASIGLISERLEKFSDVGQFSYLWDEPVYNSELLPWKGGSFKETLEALMESKIVFSSSEFQNSILRTSLDKLADKFGGRGGVYWPVRVALSGKEKSPDPVDIALAIGQERTLDRIGRAINKLKKEDENR